jgi:hypothetical protein
MSSGFKNYRIKDREKIDILKDIPLCTVNKYWSDVDVDFSQEIHAGFEIYDTSGIFIASVLEYLPEKNLALLELPKPINYFDLVKLGITMDRIVFDLAQKNIGIIDEDLKLDKTYLL